MTFMFYVCRFGQDKIERQRRKDFFLCAVQPGRRVGGGQGEEDLARCQKKEVGTKVIN